MLLCVTHALATQSSEDMRKYFRACFLLYFAVPDDGSDERKLWGEIVCNNKTGKLTASAFLWTHICNNKITLLRVVSWILTSSSLKIFNFAKGLRQVRTPASLCSDDEGRLRCCWARFKDRRAPHYTLCTLQSMEIGHKGDCTLSYLKHTLHGA